MNQVTELLGVKYPIIQGAMGVISNPEMVSAVSEAGGFGCLATAFLTDLDLLKPQVEKTQELTDKPFGANLMALNPNNDAIAKILVETGVKAVTTSGGLPQGLIDMLKAAGLTVLHVVSNVRGAVKAAGAGVDAIIAEGSESGGIQGFNGASTMVLVPLVTDNVDLPVIAAGGIGDSRGYRAALALGAQGVQVGTRFIASTECIAHDNYKDLVVEAPDTGTMLIDGGRMQFRVIRTPYAESGARTADTSEFSSTGGKLEDTWVGGDMESNTVPAGQIAGMIKSVLSVQEIMDEMVSG